MTRTAQIVIFVLAVLAIGAGTYYWMSSRDTQSPDIQAETSLGTSEVLTSTTTLPTGNSTSDASLDTDLSSIDTQLSAFSSDSAAVGASLSDQSVEQASI